MDIDTLLIKAGLRPESDPLPEFAVDQDFGFDVTIPSASTADIDLNTGAVMSTDPYWSQLIGNADKPDYWFHFEELRIDILDEAVLDLDPAEWVKLLRGARLKIRQGGKDVQYHIGHAINTPFEQVQVTQTTAADGVFGVTKNNGSIVLPRPVHLNLAHDQLKLAFSEATPTITGGLEARVRFLATIAKTNGNRATGYTINGQKMACDKGKACPATARAFDAGAGYQLQRRSKFARG